MISIKDKSKCCGCNLCAIVCPKKCIQMVSDKEGFWYPQINKHACIKCGKCERICPVINKQTMPRNTGRKAYAAIHANEKIRLASSSGGIFTAIAEKVIDRGGVVFGAAFNKDFEVEHIYVERKEDLAKFRGSKYVQGKMGDIYLRVLEFLKMGRPVLFSGTPCQIGALKAFLGKEYDNLLTVDLICHGVPSPMIWSKYVNYRKSLDSTSDLQFVSFRDKQGGDLI